MQVCVSEIVRCGFVRLAALCGAFFVLCAGPAGNAAAVYAQNDRGTDAAEPELQWASRVVKVTSALRPSGAYSASQLLGRPNALSTIAINESNPCSWVAGKEIDGSDPDLDPKAKATIRVGFPVAVHARQLFVLENLNPGAISSVRLYGEDGQSEVIYSVEAKNLPERYRFFNIFFEARPYKVKQVELTIQTGAVPGWNEIDAIALGTTLDTIRPHINLIGKHIEVNERENLGARINSEHRELLPVVTADGNTLFFCRLQHPDNIGPNKREDIWFSTKQPDGFWGEAQHLAAPLNDEYPNFVSSVMPANNTLVLGSVYKSGATPGPGVSLAYLTETGWSMPEALNIEGFQNQGPYVNYSMAADGSTLLMALFRPGGLGDMDIFVSFRREDESWSEPLNIGPDINTATAEATVFLAADNRTLYFSSEGHNGYGGNDIFMSRRLDDTWLQWSEPINLGPEINSEGWDGDFSVPASGEYVYFVSTEQSFGEQDIFRLRLPQSLRPQPLILVEGIVKDAKTGRPVTTRIIYEDLHSGVEVGRATSSPASGAYRIALPAGQHYAFRAEAPNYFAVNENLDLATLAEYSELTRDLMLVPIEEGQTVRLNNVFFSSGTADLLDQSATELARVVDLLSYNPAMTITLRGHTDNVGESSDNLRLSGARARAVADYLVRQGVARERIREKGLGETEPVADNSSAEGRRMNRRVEFQIDSE